MPTFNAKVFVSLKPSILDPQGRTIQRSLTHSGCTNILDVRVGKYIELTLSGERSDVEAQLADMSVNMLSQPVMEDVHWELVEAQNC